MDDYGTIDGSLGSAGLTLSTTDTDNLRSAGKWGRFISISGLIIIGLGVLFMLFFGSSLIAAMSMADMGGPGAAIGGSFVFVVYAIIFAISIFIYWMLYKFSTNAIKAADSGSSAAMTASIISLKNMLKIIGILWLLYLALIVLTIVLGLVGGVASAFI